jgi:ubiquitin-conjugating enzyme E2 variant
MQRESLPEHDVLLPRHDVMGPVTRAIETLSIALAVALLASHAIRFASDPGWLSWGVPAAVMAGAVLADFGSGVVHWTADTWGSESMPVLGRRFLRPFRVHHVNPRDFLRRDFVDCNGDVAMITCPIFAAAWAVPVSDEAGRLLVAFLVAFAATSLPTNQVHQWAHRPDPPLLVSWLQRARLILPRAEHERHHVPPHVSDYCIATGWCNRALRAIGFFPRLERAISRLTGAEPRRDQRGSADTADA